MKLSELANWKFEASANASEQGRKLALAGIVIVWLFAGPFYTSGKGQAPDDSLRWAGAALALALALDLVQLIARTIALELNYQSKSRASTEEDPAVPDTRGVNLATGVPFYLKFIALGVGYGSIVVYFVSSTV